MWVGQGSQSRVSYQNDGLHSYENCIINFIILGYATGVQLRVNPLKVVAGLEPEETNAFLQLIAKVILKKVYTL